MARPRPKATHVRRTLANSALVALLLTAMLVPNAATAVMVNKGLLPGIVAHHDIVDDLPCHGLGAAYCLPAVVTDMTGAVAGNLGALAFCAPAALLSEFCLGEGPPTCSVPYGNEPTANGLQYRTTYEPYGSGGWTDTDNGNNIYHKIYVCESVGAPNGYRYVFWTVRQYLNAGDSWEVWWHTDKRVETTRFEVTGLDDTSLEDWTPDGQVNSNCGSPVTLSLSASGGGVGGSLSWQYTPCGKMEWVHRQNGAVVKFRSLLRENEQSTAFFEFGVVTKTLAGSPAKIEIYAEEWFNDDCCSWPGYAGYLGSYALEIETTPAPDGGDK